MKVIKINDNLKINLDAIYSLQHYTNLNELEKFEQIKTNFIKESYKDGNLPEFEINGEYFAPDIEDIMNDNITDEIREYYVKFNDYLNELLAKPELKDEYIVFLSTGAKIMIDEVLYDKINKILDQYVINE